MPGEPTPQEFYHCYQESQRRVELWVQSTTKELSQLGIGIQSAETATAEAPSSSSKLQLPTPVPSEDVRLKVKRSSQPTPTDERPVKIHWLKPESPHKQEVNRSSRSHSHPSSGLKKIKEVDPKAIVSKSSSRSSRRREASSRPRNEVSITSYLPYGILPVLYAITRSPTFSIVAALILLAGYLLVDLDPQATPNSRRRP